MVRLHLYSPFPYITHLMREYIDIQKRLHSEIIMLKYQYNGESKNGIIRLNLRLNSDETEMDFSNIEYSDMDIRSYIENNPSVLTKMEGLRKKWN